MLQAGGWSAAAIRWAAAAAKALQAAATADAMAGSQPRIGGAALQDACGALAVVQAATAALALVSDVGYEAAVRHLSLEYFAAASKVRQARWCVHGRAACGDPELRGLAQGGTQGSAWQRLPVPRMTAVRLPALRPRAARLQVSAAAPATGGVTAALLAQLAAEVQAADVLDGAYRWA